MRLRLADAGKGLVEIRGHVGQVLALGRNGRQPERDPRLVNAFQGLLDLGLGDPQRRTGLIVFLLRDGIRDDELCVPVEGRLGQHERGLLGFERGHVGPQQGDLIIDLFDGMLKVEAQAAGFSHEAARGGRRGHEIGLGRGNGRVGDIDLHLVRRPIEFHKDVALVYAVVVFDKDPHDLPGNPRGHEGHIIAHVGIVGGNGVHARSSQVMPIQRPRSRISTPPPISRTRRDGK